jgi:predicted Zn finger-like uncharacterized protein
MIVRCPSCKTTYKVADDLVKETKPAFRCSRCKHTFELESAETLETPVDRAQSAEKLFSQTREERELSFTFAPKKQEKGENQKELINSPRRDLSKSAEPQTRTPLAPQEEIARAGFKFPARSAEYGSMSTSESTPDEPSTSDESDDSIEANKVLDPPERIPPQLSPSQPLPLARETADNVLPLDPYRDQPVSTVPFLTLFGLLVMLFAFATALHLAHPNLSEGIVRSIPLVGPSVLKNNYLKNGVALQSLNASHQTIQGNREVLVVTGVAQNQNPVVIREVRIAGQLYNLEGKEIEQQTIWIGNAISPRIIRGMTLQDISDLQRLKPLKTFEIPPGDSIPFTIVFLKSTKETKDFSCEVLGAEGEA